MGKYRNVQLLEAKKAAKIIDNSVIYYYFVSVLNLLYRNSFRERHEL